MSLPDSFATPTEYFDYCLSFFTKHKYLISSPNTHIIVDEILDYIDCEHLEDTKFDDEDFKLSNIRDKSEYIDDILTDLERLKVEYNDVEDYQDEVDFEGPVGEKKRYEVVKLTKEVGDVCREYGCDTVVDFGSGLGYLDQRLHSSTGCNVLGLECDVSHHSRAVGRQSKYHEQSVNSVVYLRHRIDENSGEEIQRYLKDSFNSHGPVCISGLHACADLTVDGMNIFLKMADVKTLILMPCCYHRMKQEDAGFKNFPISKLLKRILGKRNCYEMLQVPFLRLAAHPTRNDQGLGDMVFSLVARAVLQLYASLNKCTLKRNKRKAIKKCDSFEEYISQAALGYSLVQDVAVEQEISDGCSKEEFELEQLRSLWSNLPSSVLQKASIYIQLQNLLQPVIENFVLYDRLVYLKENGVERCWHKKLFREDQSPRCIALIAIKDR